MLILKYSPLEQYFGQIVPFFQFYKILLDGDCGNFIVSLATALTFMSKDTTRNFFIDITYLIQDSSVDQTDFKQSVLRVKWYHNVSSKNSSHN